MKRICTIVCVLALLVSTLPVDVLGDSVETPIILEKEEEKSASSATPKYFTYKNELAKKTVSAVPAQELVVTASSSLEAIELWDGKDAVLLDEAGETVQWTVDLTAAGIYEVAIEYAPYGEQQADASVGIWIDGALPYAEADQLQLESVWHNKDFTIAADEKGDHIRPTQVRDSAWHTMTLKDLYGDTVCLCLEAGQHTFGISNEDYGIYIHRVVLSSPITPPTYSAYAHGATGDEGTFFQVYEGEKAQYKSDSMLYPIYDRSSPITQPYSVENILLNTIGGGNWSAAGQWIEWEIEVPADGWYTIGMRARQNLARGLYAYRNIYIDGEIPFGEMREYAFPYNSSWKIVEFGGDEPYRFYLSKGTHTVRMEATCGPMEYTHGKLHQCLTELNSLYRKMIMITGTTPDALRDYALDKEIPELTNMLLNFANTLRDEVERVERTTGISGSELSSLIQFANLLERMQKSPDTIPSRLSVFKSNISTLAQLLTTMIGSPLEVDYIYVAQGDYSKPQADASVWQMIKHVFKQFIYSFVGDYSDMLFTGENASEPLDVWIMMGRDQAQIIKNMIQDEFTPQYGLTANLSVVNLNLSQAIMAGEGPDVVIGMAHDQPVELGVRGAILPLEEMEGFREVLNRFRAGSTKAYSYNGHTYALPETQEFSTLFVRTDIFEELGLQIPQTWSEMRSTIRKIVQANLEVGMAMDLLPTMLLQNGLSYFDEEMNFVLGGGEEIAVCEEFISFYREYNCEAYYSAANRFRTGEMPLLVAPFTTANQLAVQAPEIRGLWTMVPIPGTPQADGGATIDRSVNMGGTCNIITRNTKNIQNAWAFLEWWSTEQSQTRFANELEMQMGESARYSTANVEAFDNLSWPLDMKSVILEQGRWGNVIQQPPGNYILARNLNNIFVTLYNGNDNVRKVVQEYAADINKELLRKREEFSSINT